MIAGKLRTVQCYKQTNISTDEEYVGHHLTLLIHPYIFTFSHLANAFYPKRLTRMYPSPTVFN